MNRNTATDDDYQFDPNSVPPISPAKLDRPVNTRSIRQAASELERRSTVAAMAGTEDPAKLQILKDSLYEEARQHGSESRMFSQKDLTDLAVVPSGDPVLLLKIIQGLCDDKLFVGVTSQSGIAWRWRNREDAKKYVSRRLAYLTSPPDKLWVRDKMNQLANPFALTQIYLPPER